MTKVVKRALSRVTLREEESCPGGGTPPPAPSPKRRGGERLSAPPPRFGEGAGGRGSVRASCPCGRRGCGGREPWRHMQLARAVRECCRVTPLKGSVPSACSARRSRLSSPARFWP